MVMSECEEKTYNEFSALDSATKKIVNYLFYNAPDLWKLLYYFAPEDLPYSKDDLTDSQKANMIVKTPQEMYDPNVSVNKSVLFQINIDEAFSVARPQIRLEIGDITPADSYRGFAEIVFQIVVPNKQKIFISSYNDMADRSVAIFRELVKALNGKKIPEAGFYTQMFMNKSAQNGAGRKTGAFKEVQNKNYSGYYVVFSVWM
jgi:hypothetical protein